MTRLINEIQNLLHEDIIRQVREIGNDPILSRCRVQPELFHVFEKLHESNLIPGATLVESTRTYVYLHFDSEEKQEDFFEILTSAFRDVGINPCHFPVMLSARKGNTPYYAIAFCNSPEFIQ